MHVELSPAPCEDNNYSNMNFILTWEDKMPKLGRLHCTRPWGLSTCLLWANSEHDLWVCPPSLPVLLVAWWLSRQQSGTQSWGWCWSWWTLRSASGCWQQCKYWGISSGGQSGGGRQHRGGSGGTGEGRPAGTQSSSLSQFPHQPLSAPLSVALLPAQYQDHLKENTALRWTYTNQGRWWQLLAKTTYVFKDKLKRNWHGLL